MNIYLMCLHWELRLCTTWQLKMPDLQHTTASWANPESTLIRPQRPRELVSFNSFEPAALFNHLCLMQDAWRKFTAFFFPPQLSESQDQQQVHISMAQRMIFNEKPLPQSTQARSIQLGTCRYYTYHHTNLYYKRCASHLWNFCTLTELWFVDFAWSENELLWALALFLFRTRKSSVSKT